MAKKFSVKNLLIVVEVGFAFLLCDVKLEKYFQNCVRAQFFFKKLCAHTVFC